MGFILRPYHDESSPLFMTITKEIGYMGVIKSSRFGEYIEKPELEAFFKFAGIKHFRRGHWAYNHFNFSTQVPARTEYLCSGGVEFEWGFWKAVTVIEVAEDVSLFDRFTEIEYIFVDCLVNHKNIMSDGYFKNNDALLRGIVKRMNELSQNYSVAQGKVWAEVLLSNPELSKYQKSI